MNVPDLKSLGLKQVINASGKMTILGVSTVSEAVLAAQRLGGTRFFEMKDLMEKSGSYLAGLLNVEDAQIVSCASAGIAQSVAALIGRGSLRHVHEPFNEELFPKREIIIPKGHNVDYGTPMEVMVALGGGNVVEAGYANMCSSQHLELKVSNLTAGILYVKSHHTVQKSMLTVKEAAAVARKYDVPLIIDAAAEEDLFKYAAHGGDLVIYSGAKALSGPSAGLVIGKKEYVEWVRLQGAGIGRAMKIGKENVLGFVAAVESYLEKGAESGAAMRTRLEPFVQALNNVPYLKGSIVQDGAGRDIFRGAVQVQEPFSASGIIKSLKAGDPAVYVREYQANQGIIEFDIRDVSQDEMETIVNILDNIIRGDRSCH